MTFAIAVAELIHFRLALTSLHGEVDADELVRIAEEAEKMAPSSGSRAALEVALLERASQTLAKQDADYAALLKRAQRVLTSSDLIAIALQRDDKLRKAVLANDDVKRTIVLILSAETDFPDSPDSWSWAMLKATHPEEAARVADVMNKDELQRIERSLEERLSPLTVSRAFRESWRLEAAGKPVEARAVLKRIAADGAPMPFDNFQ